MRKRKNDQGEFEEGFKVMVVYISLSLVFIGLCFGALIVVPFIVAFAASALLGS